MVSEVGIGPNRYIQMAITGPKSKQPFVVDYVYLKPNNSISIEFKIV